MRRSLNITLALIGAVALAGCQPENRSVYKSREDCLKDWGSGQECEEINENNRHYGGSAHPLGYYYGPRYRGSAGSMVGTPSAHAVSVARGGFGSSAGFHGGGG